MFTPRKIEENDIELYISRYLVSCESCGCLMQKLKSNYVDVVDVGFTSYRNHYCGRCVPKFDKIILNSNEDSYPKYIKHNVPCDKDGKILTK